MKNKKTAQTQIFDLNEIAVWQLSDFEAKIELPPLQRGFVWKANQIEAIWDSILRGFPIGSFLLSKTEDETLFLLDGQQRATSIAIGHYNPWNDSQNNRFWSLKKTVPVIWIDLSPKDKPVTYNFSLRVVTQSHPWGYQQIRNSEVLSVSDRRKALEIFREIVDDDNISYTQLPLSKVFPYDSTMPVPLAFMIESVLTARSDWREKLVDLCRTNLSNNMVLKHTEEGSEGYLKDLEALLFDAAFDGDAFYKAVSNIGFTEIPGIVIRKEILKTEDNKTDDEQDPTLFVRFNSLGTRIAGDELIYSIYKASFPDAKELVENIGASFVAPHLVISLASRLILSGLSNDNYPQPLNVNDFTKRIKDDVFKKKLKEFIGDKGNSPAASLFSKVLEILISASDHKIPPVLAKRLVKESPELFLLLLAWINKHGHQLNKDQEVRILGSITSLSWFGTNNKDYVQNIWSHINRYDFWQKEILAIPFYKRKEPLMYPLVKPDILQKYLLTEIVKKRTSWNDLYPNPQSKIARIYKSSMDLSSFKEDGNITDLVKKVWDDFIKRLFSCKPLVLFAQREYINQRFGDFNQMDDLEDTNTPWDWDHIYPSSWIYYKKNMYSGTRHWNNCIGNYRALSLEENRGESNNLSPSVRLIDVKNQSFIKKNDWKYWEKLHWKFNERDNTMVDNHLQAIIIRMCNIYEEWFVTLNISELFGNQVNE